MDTTGSKAASGGMSRSRSPRRDPHAVPPLANGDRLSRDEFERRYRAMPHLEKAELVEGTVHMPSPVSHQSHGGPHALVVTWLGTYRGATPGVELTAHATVRLDQDNEPQPDASLFIDPARGGQTRLDAAGYLEGAPELVVEVSGTTASYDLHDKLNAYRRNGVREYLVWRVEDEAIDWFVLREGKFVALLPDADGVLKSTVFPGLWLDPASMPDRDFAGVFHRLQEGLGTPAHAAFVRDLARGS